MNPFLSAFLGAATLAAMAGLYLAVRKTWTLLDGVTKAAAGVPQLVATLKELLATAQIIAAALEALNASLGAGPSTEGPNAPPATPPRPRMPAFPGAPPFSPVQYEATEEETEIVETNDEELVQLEEAEAIREKGFTVEPDQSIVENPPGVTRDA